MRRSKCWVVFAVALVPLSGCTSGGSSSLEASASSEVPGFELAWSFDTGAATSVPAIDGQTVYVSTRDGRVLALPVDCGQAGDTCRPTWTADTGRVLVLAGVRGYDGLPTQFLPPVVADGLVLVTSDPRESTTFAFDVRCGSEGATCSPAWTANGVGPVPLIASDGFVYAVSWPKQMSVAAYGTTCARDGSTCDQTWGAPDWWWPTVADGVLYNGVGPQAYEASSGALLWTGAGAVPEGSADGAPTVGDGVVVTHASRSFTGTGPSSVYAYATGCASDGKTCAPLWTARTPDQFLSINELAISNGRVFIGTEVNAGSGTGHVLAYETDCRTDGGRCEPSLNAFVPEGEVEVISPIAAEGQVLFTSLEQGFVEAFAADAGLDGSSSKPLWRTPMMYGPEQPVIADGIAYVADNSGDLYAFDMACSTTGEVCQPIARYQAPDGVILPPVVTDGYVFAGTQAGKLLAFDAPSVT